MNEPRFASLLVIVSVAALFGCTETPEPKPPQPVGPVVPYAPLPGSGQAQFGVAETVEGAPQMNAEAAAFYRQGMAAFASGDLKKAEGFFRQATQADPKAFQAYYTMGVVQERLGSSAALTSYKQAFTIVPTYERAMVSYALLMGRKGQIPQAESFLTDQRNKRPKSAALITGLAELRSLNGDSAGSEELAQEALRIDPRYAPAMIAIARAQYRKRNLDLALESLRAVLDGRGPDNPPRDKDNAEGHLLRAYIWAEQDKRVLAMEAFKRAMQLRPDLVGARLRFATYLLESGGAQEALPILQMAVRYDLHNVDAHLSLGDAYRLTGQYQLAKREFDWVKSKSANMPEVHYNLGLLYLFAPQVPGMTPKQQVTAAIQSFNKYKELKAKSADQTDIDELLNRANLKKAELDALEKAKNPQPVAVPKAPAPAPKAPTPGAPAPKAPAPAAPAPAPAPKR
jgi:tetratricopeptide (TPR) repeat protein